MKTLLAPIWALLLIGLACCTQRPALPPKLVDMVGTYKPASFSDSRFRPTTKIELRADGTCQLTDMPYTDYQADKPSWTYYFSQSCKWTVSNAHLVITLSSIPTSPRPFGGTQLELNILNTGPPYRLAQSGENVEFDELIMDRSP